MTWGSSCPQCGKEDCKWMRGQFCDGGLEMQIQAAIDKAQAEQKERDAGKALALAQEMDGPEGIWAKKILNSVAKAIRDEQG